MVIKEANCACKEREEAQILNMSIIILNLRTILAIKKVNHELQVEYDIKENKTHFLGKLHMKKNSICKEKRKHLIVQTSINTE